MAGLVGRLRGDLATAIVRRLKSWLWFLVAVLIIFLIAWVQIARPKPYLKQVFDFHRDLPPDISENAVASAHPMWTPPARCPATISLAPERRYPGMFYCPPIHVFYFRSHMNTHNPPTPADYWMLDGPAIISQIATKTHVSKWLVNLGASPHTSGEDGERKLVSGDDCTPFWYMGYSGVNFDCDQGELMRDYYGRFGQRAKLDTTCTQPTAFPDKLRHHGVPVDLDFLKIDVDSFDCKFLDAILSAGYRPKVIDIEAGPAWPPPLMYTMDDYSGSFGGFPLPLLRGCSLQMAVEIVRPHGYTLIQYVMEDAWFVRNEFAGVFDFQQSTVMSYRLGNPNSWGSHLWPSGLYEKLKNMQHEPIEMLRLAERSLAEIIESEVAYSYKNVQYSLKNLKYTLKLPAASEEKSG